MANTLCALSIMMFQGHTNLKEISLAGVLGFIQAMKVAKSAEQFAEIGGRIGAELIAFPKTQDGLEPAKIRSIFRRSQTGLFVWVASVWNEQWRFVLSLPSLARVSPLHLSGITSGRTRTFSLMAGVDNFPGLAKNTSGRAACPLQPGQPCNLCHPDAYNGPQDCPLVAIVLNDDALREVMREKRIEHKAEEKIPQPQF